MWPLSYMKSVVDRNVIMRCIYIYFVIIHVLLCGKLLMNDKTNLLVPYVALADLIADFQEKAVSSKRLKLATEWRVVIFQMGYSPQVLLLFRLCMGEKPSFQLKHAPCLQIQEIILFWPGQGRKCWRNKYIDVYISIYIYIYIYIYSV